MAQVVEQIIEREATRVEPSNALMSALVQLRQKALFKSISVWARAGRDIDPLEPVPADIWGAYQVDYIAYLRDERGKLEATKGLTQAGYIDFHFNCEQIARYWPVVFDAVCIARLRGYAEAMRRLRKADVRESLGAGSGRQRDNPFSLGRQERADDRDEKLMARLWHNAQFFLVMSTTCTP